MAIYSDGKGYRLNSEGRILVTGTDRVGMLGAELDFERIAKERAEAGLPALTAGDVLEVMHVREGSLVIAAGARVLEAEGAAATVNLGDGADPDGFGTINANAVGVVSSMPQSAGVPAYGAGRFYSSYDTIDVTLTAVPSKAKMVVWALVASGNFAA